MIDDDESVPARGTTEKEFELRRCALIIARLSVITDRAKVRLGAEQCECVVDASANQSLSR
jgi:hypothetical protein